jgi:hypothetical protein
MKELTMKVKENEKDKLNIEIESKEFNQIEILGILFQQAVKIVNEQEQKRKEAIWNEQLKGDK